jgi:hypothetical protein
MLPAIIIGTTILAGYLYKKNAREKMTPIPASAMKSTLASIPDVPLKSSAGMIPVGAAFDIPIPPIETCIPMSFQGKNYLVAPYYIAPVGIGEALQIAEKQGAMLPTPAMVDAIWKAADLKLEPHPRKHDGTPKTMNSVEMNQSQADYIQKQIQDATQGKPFKLLAGTHKDIVQKDGKLGLYGWHQLDGKPIQGFFTGHSLDWKDYSQGLRLVKEA